MNLFFSHIYNLNLINSTSPGLVTLQHKEKKKFPTLAEMETLSMKRKFKKVKRKLRH